MLLLLVQDCASTGCFATQTGMHCPGREVVWAPVHGRQVVCRQSSEKHCVTMFMSDACTSEELAKEHLLGWRTESFVESTLLFWVCRQQH